VLLVFMLRGKVARLLLKFLLDVAARLLLRRGRTLLPVAAAVCAARRLVGPQARAEHQRRPVDGHLAPALLRVFISRRASAHKALWA
jgi:hypothetical protein